jgi:hypothetical protein
VTEPTVIENLDGDLVVNDDGTIDITTDAGIVLRFVHESSLRSWLRCVEQSLPPVTVKLVFDEATLQAWKHTNMHFEEIVRDTIHRAMPDR